MAPAFSAFRLTGEKSAYHNPANACKKASIPFCQKGGALLRI
jgi:hypothetical protein